MRIIKFRAKSLCEDWVYGDLRHYNRNPHTEKWTIHDLATGLESDIDETTVGQFTGLFDKNGKEIYEGDIIRFTSESLNVKSYTNVGVVEWDLCNPSMCIRYKYNGNIDSVEYDFIKCGIMTNEVIGNKFDNPELLRGGTE